MVLKISSDRYLMVTDPQEDLGIGVRPPSGPFVDEGTR